MYCVYLAYIASILPAQPLSYPYSLYLIIYCTASILPVQPLSYLYSLYLTCTASVLQIRPLSYPYSLCYTNTVSILPVQPLSYLYTVQPLFYKYSLCLTCTASDLHTQPLSYLYTVYSLCSIHTASIYLTCTASVSASSLLLSFSASALVLADLWRERSALKVCSGGRVRCYLLHEWKNRLF